MQVDKLKDFLCKKIGLAKTGVRLLLDGRRILDDETPLALGMEQDNHIEVVAEQTGGGSTVYETLHESCEATMKLKIIGRGDHSVTFQIKPDTEIGDLKKAYAKKVGLSPVRMKFSFFSIESRRIVVDI